MYTRPMKTNKHTSQHSILFPGKTIVFGCLFLCNTILFSASLTQIKLKNTASSNKTNGYVTFGMVFKPGDIKKGQSLTANGATLQVNTKASHADGSLRHAILTMKVDELSGNGSKDISISSSSAANESGQLELNTLLATGIDAKVTLKLGSTDYSASVKDLLSSATVTKWLSGPLCTEWLVASAFKSNSGSTHPHLHARFAIRAYQGLKSVRVDISVENDWAYEPSPMGYTYDAKITVGGKEVYAKNSLAHTHHSRWRKVYWWGEDPGLEFEIDRDYLLSTGAFPMYDKSVTVSQSALSSLKQDFEPMSQGDFTSYMPETGARKDIGPLPSFAAMYLLTQDSRARKTTLANGNCGGSYQIHYRNKNTDRPISLNEYPYMTILGNESDTKNPATGKFEAFPNVTNSLNKHTPDDAHQPSIAYLPYVISGDFFYLEELQFWAGWNLLLPNPEYRGTSKGLFKSLQTRGQAWSMRTLGQAAYITPDDHPLKSYFTSTLKNNLEWYNGNYVNNSNANKFGYIERFDYPPYGIAPWQDNFFTWSVGYVAQLGYAEAFPIAKWKANFPVTLLTNPDFCWLKATAYSLQVGKSSSSVYTTVTALAGGNSAGGSCTGKVMDGYPENPTGYGANLQPALAIAVDLGVKNADKAWEKYQTRSPKQDYSSEPQFAVVPNAPISASVKNSKMKKVGNMGSTKWAIPGNQIGYVLPVDANVTMEFYDLFGKRNAFVNLGIQKNGKHHYTWEKVISGKSTPQKTLHLVRIQATDRLGNHFVL